ncbi:ubiquitin-like-conjugating enzyme ATG10 [Megalops cyprinoides]|uniref:ubiquitin-like-conjugating enzyme ATG10 n=1 Tax=Megalops cyprinoides TaxID=118141 RepID=UPI0018644FBA|nr:ubiquitin-like-conjugating enzyme ATG10 [Megalops cyprinoides]XP_036383416.1 ubiquitin-like-conjugating enzyme ATG10 [Megalops cyprinoides]
MTGERGQGSDGFCLDEGTFRLGCQLLVQHSRALDDGWSWEEVQGSEEGFLKKTVLAVGRTGDPPAQGGSSWPWDDQDTLRPEEDQVLQDKDVEEADGDEEHADSDKASVIRYEYHVLYSCSYQAPVLYFRASTLDGRPLSLEEMWDNVHPNYRTRLLQGPWDTITQQEHPLIGQPFFVLHPCRTQEFMTPVLSAARAENRSVNYIVSWLSLVGPVVGLGVPLSYATACQPGVDTPE